ncbi:hypothetical protein GUITHDRAFT_154523 [Guillardia theta CCMP2712]|uniref:Actin-related protein 2/3 complex subunit 3 n=1 Tax=Guillardia theta (strain CCMP2712) TaxID=905079 RepID=L1ITE0_GUITC|nr:hypothetical protein GUITHDRAFT_154523 [Guillardia theta CCMP2712]EKX39159.1 hypothetical protein GUITHDRAFT_154523 [Guillardia theta CCMP2712]|eukprot:XP_005826139.1 hypothetical protein GUITHDRAFT_154523 [Guillardia theta CCMP2712]
MDLTEDAMDIVDEAITYYRANVFFRNYEIQGGADRILVYLTLYISSCLARIERCESQKDAEKVLQAYAWESFPLPGQSGFPFNGFFTKANTNDEAEMFKAYFKQLREETGKRLTEVVFAHGGRPNKFWVCFSKRKFMNLSLDRA